MQRKFKDSDPPYKIPFRNFNSRYVRLEAKKTAQSQDRASCKDGVPKQRYITSPARKARQPSDNALMRGELRLRKIRIIRIADLFIAKFSADAAAVRCYDGQAFIKFTPIALCFAIKIYEILFAIGAKKFYKAPF